MMIILTIHTAHMQRDASGVRKTVQPVRDHLGAKRADFLPSKAQVHHRPRPTRDVNDGPRERLVERGVATPESRQR